MHPEAIVIALFIAFLWGSAPVLHKIIYNSKSISPETIIVSGGIIYFLCIMVYFLANKEVVLDEILTVDRSTVMILLFNSLVAGFLANYLYYHIIKKYPGHVVSALIYSAPFFTLLLTFIFLQENISSISALGVLMIVSGVFLLTHHSH